MRTKMLDLFMSSALIQGFMAAASISAIIYLAIVGRPVPEVLVGIAMAIIGYYFGSKTQQRNNK